MLMLTVRRYTEKYKIKWKICYVAEATRDLKAYLYGLKEQLASIDKMKSLTKEEKVKQFAFTVTYQRTDQE